jgi:hypothetical protein
MIDPERRLSLAVARERNEGLLGVRQPLTSVENRAQARYEYDMDTITQCSVSLYRYSRYLPCMPREEEEEEVQGKREVRVKQDPSWLGKRGSSPRAGSTCLPPRPRPVEEGASHRSFLIASIVRPEVMIPIVGEGVTEAIGPKLSSVSRWC